MRGGEDDAGAGLEITDRKGQRGDRLDARIHVHLDAVGGEYASRDLLELLALKARVTSEREGGVLIVSVKVVRNTLGRLSYHILVHAVGANTQRAAQASRAKLEAAIERVEQLVLVVCGDELVQLLLEVGDGYLLLPLVNPGLNFCVHSCSPPNLLCLGGTYGSHTIFHT